SDEEDSIAHINGDAVDISRPRSRELERVGCCGICPRQVDSRHQSYRSLNLAGKELLDPLDIHQMVGRVRRGLKCDVGLQLDRHGYLQIVAVPWTGLSNTRRKAVAVDPGQSTSPMTVLPELLMTRCWTLRKPRLCGSVQTSPDIAGES